MDSLEAGDRKEAYQILLQLQDTVDQLIGVLDTLIDQYFVGDWAEK